jgi:hypothetical protein
MVLVSSSHIFIFSDDWLVSLEHVHLIQNNLLVHFLFPYPIDDVVYRLEHNMSFRFFLSSVFK